MNLKNIQIPVIEGIEAERISDDLPRMYGEWFARIKSMGNEWKEIISYGKDTKYEEKYQSLYSTVICMKIENCNFII